jgi:hypothetical protein
VHEDSERPLPEEAMRLNSGGLQRIDAMKNHC